MTDIETRLRNLVAMGMAIEVDELSVLTEAAVELEKRSAEIVRMATAFDEIYNHSDYARGAVIDFYGLHHKPWVKEIQATATDGRKRDV